MGVWAGALGVGPLGEPGLTWEGDKVGSDREVSNMPCHAKLSSR